MIASSCPLLPPGTRRISNIITIAMQLTQKVSASHYSRTVGLQASSTFTRTRDEQRVYILGIGNLGKLFAHSLARKPCPPPVTLLLHREGLVREWEEAGGCIELITNGISNKQCLFDVELLDDGKGIESSGGPIGNVIVATKAPRTTAALAQIKHRLNQCSTILFTQNGMGTQMRV